MADIVLNLTFDQAQQLDTVLLEHQLHTDADRRRILKFPDNTPHKESVLRNMQTRIEADKELREMLRKEMYG